MLEYCNDCGAILHPDFHSIGVCKNCLDLTEEDYLMYDSGDGFSNIDKLEDEDDELF